MNKMKTGIMTLLFLILFFSCKKESMKNHEASILKMTFDFGDVIFDGSDGATKAPDNIELEKLIPTIEISEGAVIYPPSKATTDFTKPVSYTVTSEDQEHVNYYTVAVLLPIVKFKVFDCTNRSKGNPTAELASETKISIFKEDDSGDKQPIEDITTDAHGVAFLYGDRDIMYYFSATKNGAVDLIDGYIVYGVFESQEDIDNYPPQNQPSQVGDLKFMDTNGDGRVNEDDMVDYRRIWGIPESGVKEIEIYIAKE